MFLHCLSIQNFLDTFLYQHGIQNISCLILNFTLHFFLILSIKLETDVYFLNGKYGMNHSYSLVDFGSLLSNYRNLAVLIVCVSLCGYTSAFLGSKLRFCIKEMGSLFATQILIKSLSHGRDSQGVSDENRQGPSYCFKTS